MEAAFSLGSGRFEIRNVPTPEPKQGEALVRVKACGICGSDKSGLARPTVREIVSGHELSGVVERVNATDAVAVGQEIIADPIIPCGECKYCKVERTFLCSNRQGVIGYGVGGGFAEYVCIPARCLYPKPTNIDFAEASMAEPLAVAVGAAHLRDVTALDCIVFGAGAIGTMLAQVLKTCGADNVLVVDVNENHLAIARQTGDFITINATDESAWNALEGTEVKVAYDVVGHSSAVTARALDVLPPQGALICIGAPNPGALRLDVIEVKGLSVIRTMGVSIAEMRQAVNLLASGDVHVKPLVTGRFPLERIEEAFQASLGSIKVVVEP